MSESPSPTIEAVIKDLEIQWKDHFHMRDQTWKVLTNTLLVFLGAIGLEIKGVQMSVMICAYGSLILIALFGALVATHHRIRQGQKFAIIRKHEEFLGLYAAKEQVLAQIKPKRYAVFTVRFIAIVQILIAAIAATLLVTKAFA